MSNIASVSPLRQPITGFKRITGELKLVAMPPEVKARLEEGKRAIAEMEAMMRDPSVAARHDAVRAHTVFRNPQGRILGVLWQDGQDADWSGRGAHGLDKSGPGTITPAWLDRFAATLKPHFGPGVVAERVAGRADAPTRGEIYAGTGAGADRVDLAGRRALDRRV